MTTTASQNLTAELGAKADRHLWGHFARHGEGNTPPIITRGDGVYIYDSNGKRYIDGLSGLFVVQVGHGREEIADAIKKQAQTLEFFPLWSYATPPAIELAERLAGYAPGDLNRVFFTTGGGDAVESAWKLAKQYYKLTGKPGKYKVISRSIAYHGTPHGALAITGLPTFKQPFEPITPAASGCRTPTSTARPRATTPTSRSSVGGRPTGSPRPSRWRAGSVAAVFLEPVQNAGGCFPPPPGYFERVREICDEYDVLLVSDETICAFGRIGSMFACNDFNYVPDIITCAKGLTSGYAPLGAMIASDRLFEPFNNTDHIFAHGYTWGGHPVSAAAAAGQPRRLRARSSTTTSRPPRRRSGPPWRSCSTCRSSVTSAARASSTASSSSGTRPPRRSSTTSSPSGCCAASCPPSCSRPGCTAGPTTAATRWCSWPRR